MYISTIQQGNTVRVWERNSSGVRIEKEYDAPYYFYLEDEEGEYKSIFGKRLSRYDFDDKDEFISMVSRFKSRNIPVYESDISCELKVLSANYYDAKLPVIHMAFFDIEVDYDERIGHADSTNPYAPINAISIGTYWNKKSYVIAVPPQGWDSNTLDSSLLELAEIILVKDEKALLRKFLDIIEDADLLSGWNSQFFDIPYICERLLINFGKTGLARMSFPNSRNPRKREVDVMGKTQFVYDLYGRVHLDYIDLFKKYEVAERPSYKLESISEEVLPNLQKLEYTGSLAKQYRENFNWFLRYNIRDTEILVGFEEKLGYVQVANVMAHTSTAKFNDVLGTIRLADTAIINQCHYVEDVIVPDWQEQEDGSIRGAYVLYPQIGMHQKLGSIDINSLYPNAIRAVNISPETMVGQFLNNIRDFEEIRNETDALVRLEYMDGKIEEKTANDWYTELFERKWSVSGYGTVFTQEKIGVIPSILAAWYAKRKDYQRKEGEFEQLSIEYLKTHGKQNAGKGLVERESVFLTDAEAKEYDSLCEQTEYNHKLQYVYKIKLNSLYGALTNYRFRFFRLELGESTTGTGRAVLKHQCRKTAELLDGAYNVDFPLYATVEEALENGETADAALNGPKFKGKFEAPSVVYGDSVAGNSLVYTPNGQVHISSLFTSVDDKNESTGKEYCTTNLPHVLSYNENTNRTEYHPVVYIMRHKCEKRMFRVWTTNSMYVDVTEDHSLMGYVNTRYRAKYDNRIITKIGPTDVGRHINSVVHLKRVPYDVISGDDLPELMFVLMGYVFGDGYVDTTRTGGTLLSIGSQDMSFICNNLLDPLKNQGWLSSYTIKPNGHDVQISGVRLRDFLRTEMYDVDGKRIPPRMFNEHPKHIAAFLRGWFSADGHVSGKQIGLTNIHARHIIAAQQLLFRLGISSSWFTETTENSFKGKISGTFSKRLTIRGRNAFAQQIGFFLPRKQQKIYPDQGKKILSHQKYDFDVMSVRKVEEIVYDDYVYDIEVADTHTFFANDILVHNTDSTYFVTHAKTDNQARKIADYVAEQVNASYPEFMTKAFRCQPEFTSVTKCGREIVADNGIFVSKKRYILHMVDKDGTPCDKMKIMGLELKKTTLPKPIQKKLIYFVEKLLRGADWDALANEIVDYKRELMNPEAVLNLGLPKGIKGIEAYTSAWKDDSTTRLPGHVAAAILYNKMLEEHNDKTSPQIFSGSKLRTFYLTKRIGRFKAIAVPTDMTEMPQWFVDEFVPLIDADAQIERLVDKPLEKIFDAINKKVPTPQSLYLDDLFCYD